MKPITSAAIAPLKAAWKVAAKDPLFLVRNGREYLVEGPDERWDTADGDEPEESMLRVFTDYEHAVLYCDLQRDNYVADESEMEVITTNLEHLFGLLGIIEQNSIAEFDAPVRVELSVMATEDEFPSNLDTLYSSQTTVH